MTSRLCLSFRDGQYGKSHKQILLLQRWPICKSHKQILLPQIGTRFLERFLFYPTLTSLTFSNSSSSSFVVKDLASHCYHGGMQIHCPCASDDLSEGNDSAQYNIACSLWHTTKDFCHNGDKQSNHLWYALIGYLVLDNHECTTTLQHKA